jgi:hypothetical protein
MTGGITTSVSGGTGSYTYLWSTGVTTANLTGVGAGLYSVTVTDANQCTTVNSWPVSQPSAVAASAVVTNASCPGQSDGTIDVNVSGGTGPYTYLWSNGAVTEDLSGIPAGTYSITVTDANGCPGAGSWNVGVTSSVCANVSVTGTINTLPAVCYDATNIITVAGGGNVFEVYSPGQVTFMAGMMIKYLPGTKVTIGGYMHGKITSPSGPFCSSTKITEVTTGAGDPITVTERQYFSLFPNPTSGNVTLLQKGDRIYDNVRVEIFSMNGARILSATMIGEKQHEFRTADLPSGLYFVKIYADQYVETIKLVKTN